MPENRDQGIGINGCVQNASLLCPYIDTLHTQTHLVEVGECGRSASTSGVGVTAAWLDNVLLDVRQVAPPKIQHSAHLTIHTRLE